MEGGSAPGEASQFQKQSQSIPEDRGAVIQACYELVCSGQPLSSILAEAKRLSAATTAVTIGDACGEICAAAPCAGASQREKLEPADTAHPVGLTKPEVPTWIGRPFRRWRPIGLFLLSLMAATCAITAVGISRKSVWPVPVETSGAETVTSDVLRQPSPGSSAKGAVAQVDVPTTSAIAALTPTAATSAFEESGRQSPLPEHKHPFEKTERRGVAQPSVLTRKRAQNNVSDHQLTTTAHGGAGFPPPVPHPGPVWQYDQLIGRYVPLAGSTTLSLHGYKASRPGAAEPPCRLPRC